MLKPRSLLEPGALLRSRANHLADAWSALSGAGSERRSRRANNIAQLVLEIQQHIEQNDLEGARSLIAGARTRFPANGGLENLLGVIETQEGHTDRAIQEFSAAILHDPSLAGAYLNLGRIYMQKAGER